MDAHQYHTYRVVEDEPEDSVNQYMNGAFGSKDCWRAAEFCNIIRDGLLERRCTRWFEGLPDLSRITWAQQNSYPVIQIMVQGSPEIHEHRNSDLVSLLHENQGLRDVAAEALRKTLSRGWSVEKRVEVSTATADK